MKAIFFDRDGTLIDEPEGGDIATWEQFKVRDDIASLNKISKDYIFFIISNQKGIATGAITNDFYNATNIKLAEILKGHNITIEKFYTCPHGVESICDCRKPKRGLIDQVLMEYDINLSESFVVGDRATDIELAQTIGAKSIYLPTANYVLPADTNPTYVSETLEVAMEYILSDTNK
jgi:histidinol-phosphate phosphatase family protein